MQKLFAKRNLLPLLGLTAVLFVIPESAEAALLNITESVLDFVTIGLRTLMETAILPTAAGLFSLVGLLFDSAVDFSLHTGYIFSLSKAVDLGWVIIRDVANIFFIFILIYISLGTIVQGTKFGTKQLLTQVIIAALLINFSLFITKAVIDVSNVFGNWIYGGVKTTLQYQRSATATQNPSLTDLINARLGIIQLWTGGSNAVANASSDQNFFSNPENGIIGQTIRLSVVLIAIYMFAYCAIMFLARSITLLFLMVFSPIGFMGGVLPQLKKYSTQWRDELVSAAIFPVAFLLMLYISLQFINSLHLLNINTDSRVSLYFQYFIIIFLLHATLKVAKENSGDMGKALTGMAEGLGKTITGWTLGAVTGGTGLALRATVGRSAAAMADSEWAKNMVGSKSRTVSLLGSGIRSTAKWTSKRGFDATKPAAGFVEDLGGIKTSTPKWMQAPKDGYVGAQKARTKAQRELAGELYASEAQSSLVNLERAKYRNMAEREVGETTEAQENVKRQDILETQKFKQIEAIKEVKNKISEAKAKDDFANQAALEAELHTIEEGNKETEENLKKTRQAYDDMVNSRVDNMLETQAKTNESLAKALKAEQRLENYAENIETDALKKWAASLSSVIPAVPGGVLGGVVYSKMTKENKTLADRIRKDKKEGYIKKQKEKKENLSILEEALKDDKKGESGSEKKEEKGGEK